MKVTALISDDLLNEVKSLSHAKTTTDALVIVMKEWLASKKLRELNRKIRETPFQFADDFSAEKVRELNLLDPSSQA